MFTGSFIILWWMLNLFPVIQLQTILKLPDGTSSSATVSCSLNYRLSCTDLQIPSEEYPPFLATKIWFILIMFIIPALLALMITMGLSLPKTKQQLSQPALISSGSTPQSKAADLAQQ